MNQAQGCNARFDIRRDSIVAWLMQYFRHSSLTGIPASSLKLETSSFERARKRRGGQGLDPASCPRRDVEPSHRTSKDLRFRGKSVAANSPPGHTSKNPRAGQRPKSASYCCASPLFLEEGVYDSLSSHRYTLPRSVSATQIRARLGRAAYPRASDWARDWWTEGTRRQYV